MLGFHITDSKFFILSNAFLYSFLYKDIDLSPLVLLNWLNEISLFSIVTNAFLLDKLLSNTTWALYSPKVSKNSSNIKKQNRNVQRRKVS